MVMNFFITFTVLVTLKLFCVEEKISANKIKGHNILVARQ